MYSYNLIEWTENDRHIDSWLIDDWWGFQHVNPGDVGHFTQETVIWLKYNVTKFLLLSRKGNKKKP